MKKRVKFRVYGKTNVLILYRHQERCRTLVSLRAQCPIRSSEVVHSPQSFPRNPSLSKPFRRTDLIASPLPLPSSTSSPPPPTPPLHQQAHTTLPLPYSPPHPSPQPPPPATPASRTQLLLRRSCRVAATRRGRRRISWLAGGWRAWWRVG